MELFISLKSQLLAAKSIILVSVVYFIFIYVLYLYVEYQLFVILFQATLLFYALVFFLPVLILHINYLKKTTKGRIELKNRIITINDKIYTAQDVQCIEIYATYQHFNNTVGATSLPYNDAYYYLIIYLNDGEQIVLSSLIDYNIDKICRANFAENEIKEKTCSYFNLLI